MENKEIALSLDAYDALLYIHNVERGSVSFRVCQELTTAGFITPLYAAKRHDVMGAWFVKIHEAGSEYVKTHMQDNDDLPFTDIGTDPDDTQELPIVKADTTLSQLVDAALMGATPCQRIDALRTLRNEFDWECVPSNAVEAELIDINYAFNDAINMRNQAKRRCALSENVTPQDVKNYAKAHSFCTLVEAVFNLLFDCCASRANHSQQAVR